ncbi:MAG: RNA polymerase sigma factor [Chloroflexota bacterium]|jgi:RNA polymerase sigma-70 factor (ECF subfamily)|nr:RNA polymerase sigma factor [Chloroflexota bacterium]
MQVEQVEQVESQRRQPVELMPAEWERLVRLCGSLSGSADAAEDLAQETLIEAWRNAEKLQNPDAQRQWLSGIARNVCRRWLRSRERDIAKYERLVRQHGPSFADETRHHAGGPELEIEMERDELADLLDQALALLPASTRDVLVQRYVDERTHAEIADQLGLSEGTVAVRIHRGKQALRQSLANPELSASALAYGLIAPDAAGWQLTPIWCPFCGKHRLNARIDRESGDISGRCAGRCFGDGIVLDVRRTASGTMALTSVKSMLTRELIDLHQYYRQALAEHGGACQSCGRPATLERWSPDEPSSLANHHPYGIRLLCRACGLESGASLWHLLIDTPVAQQFWRRYPRMRALPVREVEVDGRLAMLSGFASSDSSARLDILSATHTYEILHVDGAVER